MFYSISDLHTTLHVPHKTARRIMTALNKELAYKGYLTIAGRISRRYLEQRIKAALAQ